MPATAYTKLPLGGSVNGKQILITATESSSADIIHAATELGTATDEVWLYAYNDATSSAVLNFLWGGISEPEDVVRVVIGSRAGRTLLVDGKLLQSGSIWAYSSLPSSVIVDGFINRITPMVLDPIVSSWAGRLYQSFEITASNNTLQALNTFVTSLKTKGVWSKLHMVNCFVPDHFTASFTPLYVGRTGYSTWLRTGFVSDDLTVNGMKGNGANTKYFNTGFIPSHVFNSVSSSGITIYYAEGTDSASNENTFGCANNFTTQRFDTIQNQNGVGYFLAWRLTAGSGYITWTGSSVTGYVSANRAFGEPLTMYNAASAIPHYKVVSGSTIAVTGLIPTIPMFCFSISSNGSPNFGSGTRMSFASVHEGLTESESLYLYEAVQTMRQSFGGGYL